MTASSLPSTNEAATTSPAQASSITRPTRRTGAFVSPAARRRWWIVFSAVCAVALLSCIGLLVWRIPRTSEHPFSGVSRVDVPSRSWRSPGGRVPGHGHGRLPDGGEQPHHHALHPRLRVPLSGDPHLHDLLPGVAGLNASATVGNFVGQLGLMIALTLALYSWLLTSQRASMHAMLLIGVMLGAGLGSISTFMQRLLTPSEFDVLTARLFGSIANAQKEYFPIAVPLVAVAALALVLLTRRLSVLSLGRETATNLGLNHRRTSVVVLVLVSILMATSTALVGPMTFLGFLVATLSYQFSDTHDHRFIFAMAVALGIAILSSAYFVMNHIFNTQGVVSIIIEFVGGLAFIVTILRKGRL